MQNYISNVCEIVRHKIKSEMNGKLLSLQIDLTHHLNRCIFGVDVQFYVLDKLVQRTLTMKRLLSDTKGVTLAVELKKMLESYGVDVKQIYTLTSDNGSNVVKCTKIMQVFQRNQLEDFLDSDIQSIGDEEINDMADAEMQRIARNQDIKYLYQIHCSVHTMQLCISDIFSEENSEWKKFSARVIKWSQS